MNAIDLNRAKLCLNCDMIYDGEECPRCAQDVYWWVKKWLTVQAKEKQNESHMRLVR
jgi:hypothetical protein